MFCRPVRTIALLCCITFPSLALAADPPPKEKPPAKPGTWTCEINQKGAPWCGPCHEQKDKACEELVPSGEKCVWQTVPGSPGKECLYLHDGGPDYCYTNCDVEGSNCNVPRIPANTACCSYAGAKPDAPPKCTRCDFKDKTGKDDPKKMRDDLWKGKKGPGGGGGRTPPPPPPPARDCCPPDVAK